MTESKYVTVQEDKFNGVATLIVKGIEDKKVAKNYARKFWREEYDTSPSKIVAEKKDTIGERKKYEVMVADHSSGSLKETKAYEHQE